MVVQEMDHRIYLAYDKITSIKTTDVTGEIQLPIEIDMAMPGETLDITIELIQPIKITEEEPFIIRDDECTVGLGRVATIIE